MQPFSNKSNIPKICAFDCHTNTCINIQTFFFSMLRYKNSCIISRWTSYSHLFITPPPLALKREHSLNMAVLSKTYKYILYNKQSFKSRQHSSLVSIEIPSITISLFSIFVNTSVNSQYIFKFIWVGLFQLCGIRQQMGRQIQQS